MKILKLDVTKRRHFKFQYPDKQETVKNHCPKTNLNRHAAPIGDRTLGDFFHSLYDKSSVEWTQATLGRHGFWLNAASNVRSSLRLAQGKEKMGE